MQTNTIHDVPFLMLWVTEFISSTVPTVTSSKHSKKVMGETQSGRGLPSITDEELELRCSTASTEGVLA
jgi:hypothetical protein